MNCAEHFHIIIVGISLNSERDKPMKKIRKTITAVFLALSVGLLGGCSQSAGTSSNFTESSVTDSESVQSGEEKNDSSDVVSENSKDEASDESSDTEKQPLTDFDKYVSNTCIATGNNYYLEESENITYRAYFPVEQYGELEYRFYFSNTVDSTYNYKGKPAYVGLAGGEYTISNAVIADGGTGPDDEITNRTAVTFGGESEKAVTANETYWSDSVTIDIPEGHYLVWEWTVNGTGIPCTKMSTLTSTTSSTDGEKFDYCDDIPLPQIIGANREVKHTVAAIGDSITQGCQTDFMAYEFWAAQLAAQLGSENSFYNAGLGWSRASDAAECGDWLERTSYADIVLVAFGTNDIGAGKYGKDGKNTAEDIEGYLTTVVTKLKEAGCTVILFNSPPQDYKEINEGIRTELNNRIPELAKELGAEYFDFAGLLCDASAPSVPLYGGHPDGEAGTIVSKAFMKQFAELFA